MSDTHKHSKAGDKKDKPKAWNKLLFIGPPLAGKGTQASALAKSLSVPHISLGDLLRKEIEEGSEEKASQLRSILEKGLLVPDNIIAGILKEAIGKCKNGYVLDGFPRTLDQMHQIDFEYDQIFLLDTTIAVIMDRLAGRLVHPASGRTYNVKYNPPRSPGFDDETHEPLIKREDDRPEVLMRRISDFNREIKLVVKEATEKGKLTVIDGSQDKDSIKQNILSICMHCN